MRGLFGRGKSERYRLKSEGDMTPPCGTPVLNVFVFESQLLYVV